MRKSPGSFPYLNVCQIFEQCNNAGMVEAAPTADAQSLEELFDECRHRNRRFDGFGGVVDEIQIFEVKVDLESGRKVTVQDFLRFLIQALTSGKTTRQSTNH